MGRTSDSRKRLIDAGHELIWANSYGSVTIDAICDRAQVKKGTFYHFFNSKADLAIVTIDNWWAERKGFVRECFSPEVPPIERILRYVDSVVQGQLQTHAETGRMLGCPMFTLACEICTQDEKIRAHIQEVLDLGPRLFGEAICDAQKLGQVGPGDPHQKARILWAFYEGTLVRARVENNPQLLLDLCADLFEIAEASIPMPTLPGVPDVVAVEPLLTITS